MTARPDLSALRIDRGDEDAAKRPIIGWVIAIVVAVALAWIAWVRWVVPARAPLVEVIVAKPAMNVSNPPLLTATGYIVANRQAKITPKWSGKVVRLNFEVGQKVKRGQVLAVLESSDVEARLEEGRAALADAQREFDRQSALWKQGVTSRALLDNADARRQAARARVAQIEINRTDMVVRAPFDGTIATKSTEVGEVISSVMIGQVAGTLPAGAICTLVDLATLEVEADVNESNIAQLREGQPAEVSVDAFPGRKWRGMVRQIIPTADRAKATVKVKVKIVDPGDRLLPEMSATAAFLERARSESELRETPRIWLPAVAVTGGRVAVVGEENRVALRPVTTGATHDGRVEITGGLKGGEHVVISAPRPLEDGDLVRVNGG
ncbi:MAG: efflux RND transporter periplasmic adaptor subunit [Acidobacteriota bacterium]